MKLKSFYIGVIKLILLMIIMYLFCVGEINSTIAPFGIALAFALMGAGIRSFIVAPIYFAMNVLTDFGLTNIIITTVTAGVILIVGLFYMGKKIKIPFSCLYLIAGISPFVYYNGFVDGMITNTILSVTLSLVSLIALHHFFTALASRPLVFKFTLDEGVSACFFVMVLGIGVASINIPYFNLFLVFSILWVLLSTFMLNKNYALLTSVMLGIGYAVCTLDLTFIATNAIFSITAISFKNEKRIYSLLGIVLVSLVFTFYLGVIGFEGILSIAEILIPCLLVWAMPQSWLDKVYGYFCEGNYEQSARNIVNRSRQAIYKRLIELSNVFSEMDIVFRKMTKGILPVEDAKKMLARECRAKLCSDCPDRTKCFRNRLDTEKILQELVTVGFERGRITLLDIPAYMTTQCTKTNQILIVVNGLIEQYKQYANMINNLDGSRILIAEQLNGVARIMRSLGNELNNGLLFNTTGEQRLIEELMYNNIICNEAIIYVKDENTSNVSVVIRNNDIENPSIPKITSKICGTKLSIKDVTPSQIKGWSIVNMTTSPKYDVVFGYAGASKTGQEISGDNYSLLRLGDNKFMMAVCDGMGSGEKANKTSELAINLVENFYKAGFDNDIILSSVNKLLSLNNEETFTALDICVIDLNNSFADFIKLGATFGFIKHSNYTDIIDSSSLPIGILDEMKPSITKTVLQHQDMFILCSDGVTDAFANEEVLQVFINNATTLHPQNLADLILEKAMELSSGIADDDMTVLVGRVYTKI